MFPTPPSSPRRPALTVRTALPALIAASLLAAGCATTAPTAPAWGGVAVPAGWSSAADPTKAAPAAPALDPTLWRAFADPTLDRLLDQALAANTDLLGAQARLRQARAARDAAGAALLPSLGASAQGGRSRTPPADARNSVRAGFDASWELDLWGANGHAAAAAEADAEASAATLEATRLAIAGELALGLVQWRSTLERLSLARASLETQRETAQIVGWRVQAGLASALDRAQAESAVAQNEAQIPALEASAAQSRHALAVLVGQAPATLVLDDAAARPVAAASNLGETLGPDTPAGVLRRRPDVLAAERSLEAAARRVAQQDAEALPKLSLQASLAWSAATLGSLGSGGAAASLLAGLSQPLFDGGTRRAAQASQQAAFDAARAAYAASVLTALKDVDDALATRRAAVERLASLRRAEAAATEAAELARQRYASGIVDFQTVLDTQRTLLGVQDSRASAVAEELGSQVRLLKALGVTPPASTASTTVPTTRLTDSQENRS